MFSYCILITYLINYYKKGIKNNTRYLKENHKKYNNCPKKFRTSKILSIESSYLDQENFNCLQDWASGAFVLWAFGPSMVASAHKYL